VIFEGGSDVLRVVADEQLFADYATPPMGSAGKTIYLKALKAGTETIVIQLNFANGTSKLLKQKVNIAQRPVYRC
jgi:hypothetical protein